MPTGLICIAEGGSDADSDTDSDTDTGTDAGTYWHFVQSACAVPVSTQQARDLGVDLDGNGGAPDNAIGNVFAVLSGQGIDMQAEASDSIARGKLLVLHSIHANDVVADPSVTLQVFLAADVATPDFSGRGAFSIAAEDPGDSVVAGAIEAGHFSGGPAEITIDLPSFGGLAVSVRSYATRIATDIDDLGCTDGRLAGGIRDGDVFGILVPGWALGMQAAIDADPDCPDACDAHAQTMLDLFDADLDGSITAFEIQTDPLLGSLLQPDLDLFDADGDFAPGSDGVYDALSFGLGFTCVRATFTAPGE